MIKKDILLIEDNPDDETLALRALKKNHIINEIIVVRDGEEALNYLFCKESYSNRDSKNQPEVILLDLKLPKISGLEILQEIRKHKETKYLPVVVLTSSDEERDLVESYKLGANSYIRKPVDFEKFQQAILDLSLYWLVLNKSLNK